MTGSNEGVNSEAAISSATGSLGGAEPMTDCVQPLFVCSVFIHL